MNPQTGGKIISFDRSAAYWQRRAGDHRRKGHYTRAAALLRQAAGTQRDASALLELGEMMNQLECWESARTLLSRLAALNPLFGSAYYALAQSYIHLGDLDNAVECLEYALDLAKDDSYYEDAQQQLAEIEQLPGESARAQLFRSRGLTALAFLDLEGAEQLFLHALRTAQDKAGVLLLLSITASANKDDKKSRLYIARAIKADPKNFHVRCMLCTLLFKQGKTRAARGFLQMAVPLMKTTEDEHRLCQTAAMLNWHTLILRVMEAQLKKHPNRLPILYDLAVARLNTGDTSRGFALLEHAARLDPDVTYIIALRQELNELGPDKFLAQSVPYYPDLTRSMSLRMLSGLKKRMADDAPMIEPDPLLWAQVEAVLNIPLGDFKNLMLHLPMRISRERREEAVRILLYRPILPHMCQTYYLLTMSIRNSPAPYLGMARGRLVLLDQLPNHSGKAPLFNAFTHTLLNCGTGLFTAKRLIDESIRLWQALSHFFRLEAGGEMREIWSVALLIHLSIKDEKYDQARRLTRRSDFSPRRLMTLCDIISVLEPDKEEEKHDS